MSATPETPRHANGTAAMAAMADMARRLATRHLHGACLAGQDTEHGGQDRIQGPPPALHGPSFVTGMFELLDCHNRLLEMAHHGRVFPVALEAFVGLLQGHKVLPQALGYVFDQHERVQNCAFIAQRMFGLNLGYEYHHHAYGTFSPRLAIDFSEIAREGRPTDGTFIPPAFDTKRFVSLVSGRSIAWLSAASAVLHETRPPKGRGPALLRALGVARTHNRLLVYGAIRALARCAPAIPGLDHVGDGHA